MRISRIYHPDSLSLNQELELEPQAASHLTKVLRLSADAELVLFNGDGCEYSARIIRIQRQRAWVCIHDSQVRDLESSLKIHLCQCISKGERMDYTIQKAVELGVTHITPLISEHVAIQLKADRLTKRLNHWQGIINSACEQSGRNSLPQIDPPEKLEQWIQAYDHDTTKLTLVPDATMTLKTLATPQQSFTLLIGPEGGLSQNEITLSEQFGFKGIKLGPRILRTETAAVTMISILQGMWGDLA